MRRRASAPRLLLLRNAYLAICGEHPLRAGTRPRRTIAFALPTTRPQTIEWVTFRSFGSGCSRAAPLVRVGSDQAP